MFGRRVHGGPFGAVVVAARAEALRRGDRRIGTEHLLLGLLHGHDQVAGRVLGTDLESARAGLRRLDREALSVVGIDLDDVPMSPAAPARRTPPMTSAAAAALGRAGEEAPASEVRAEHLLRALLARRRPDAAVELLEALDVDRGEAMRALDVV